MSHRGDERAQSVQIGAAILLAFIVLAIASYQASVVPSQNQQVEYNHNQQVQSQMQDVRSGIVSVPGGGAGRSVSVQLGTTYPDRTLFVNPGPPSGNLRTTPPDDIVVANTSAAGEAGDYWDGTTHNVSTRGMVYTADYAVWQNAPRIVYENSVSYNEYRADTIVESDQRIVRGRQITIVALNGSYQEASTRTVSVDLEGVSTSSNAVTVRDDGGNVTLRFPTELSEEKWMDLLENQLTDNGGYVVNVTVIEDSGRYDTLVIELEPGEEYTLQMAKVGIGSNVAQPEPEYVLPVEGNGTTVPEGTSTELVVEVRDKFNNPVSGVSINSSTALSNSSVRVVPDDTGSDGRVTLVYDAPDDVSGSSVVRDRINVSFTSNATSDGGFDSTTPENASLTVRVSNTDGSGVGGGGGGGGPGINPNRTDGVVLRGANISGSGCSGGNDCLVRIKFENRDQDQSRNITEVQYSFYSIDSQGGGKGSTRSTPKSTVVNGTRLSLRGAFEPLTPDVVIGPGNTTTVDARFYKNTGATAPFDVQEGDFFVFRVIFVNGDQATYFIAPEN